MSRNIRLCYWDAEHRILDAVKLELESAIQTLGDIEIIRLDKILDTKLQPCDLLIVSANHVPSANFVAWLTGFAKRHHQQVGVWIPTLFLASLDTTQTSQVLDFGMNENWYFDIIEENQFSSLSIRVANLLKIHDHLHEIKRYEKEFLKLQQKIEDLERTVKGG